MKVDYVSDLHLNHWVLFKPNQTKLSKNVYSFLDEVFSSKDEDSEVLILGGDYSEYNSYTEWMINYVSKLYDKVIIIFGNHDFYLNSKTQERKYKRKSVNRAEEIKEYVESFENVEVLDESFTEFRGKVFYGTVNYPHVNQEVLKFMKENSNDYKYISGDTFHSWNKKNPKEKMKDTQIDVLISHVPPLLKNPLSSELEDNILYSNDLDLGLNVRNVIFGHDHTLGTFNIGHTKYHTNALGYPQFYTHEVSKCYDLSDIIRTTVI